MHSLLLFDKDAREISVAALERIFQSVSNFKRIRLGTPINPIEAEFVDGEDFTTIDLDPSRMTISIRGTSGAALRAAWILQSHLTAPLRMVDTDYSFDLILSDFSSIEELERAIDQARSI
ncbi:MAG: hypothetical protein JNG90_10770 [Planctomycetaceae bacterium]|nr:hypothetical protein [Planctomycetaceae bacterium]